MRAYGPGIALVGAAIVVLTASGYRCALTAEELLKLYQQRMRNMIEQCALNSCAGGLKAGKSVEEVMRELDSS